MDKKWSEVLTHKGIGGLWLFIHSENDGHLGQQMSAPTE